MGRYVLGSAVAGAVLLAGCNMLSGADALSSGVGEDDAEITSPRRGDASSNETSRAHDAPLDGDAAGEPPDDSGVEPPSDAATAVTPFFDDFARPNGALGNDWLVSTPATFALVNGAAQQNSTGNYRNLFVRRPADEDVRDVRVEGVVTFSVANADPCLFARLRADGTGFHGYSVYPDGAGDLYVSRDDGAQFVDMGGSQISPPLTIGEHYRLSLQVTGTSPVQLVGSIAKLDGTVLASIRANDGSAKKITASGSVGFGSSSAMNGRFDDFRRSAVP